MAQKMHDVVTDRAEHVRTTSPPSEGEARYVLVKDSDPGREITLTTLLFDVPAA